jgi:class 3 adenylate cyclase/tetratricopeptide (TPR) repeat protein
VLCCPACGEENPERAKFCLECGAGLAVTSASAALEERKVVSVLFCDLVGFTAASEVADPEDVRARIRPYHARLRREIERFGGTVEKFVGDAVMAVFGAPVAHEDDAERAVRAGLRALEAIEELNVADPGRSLQVRVGVNTGEAVVALGARPEEGEGMVTGDVVNTASRLQGAAPVDAVVVSEQTYRLTERVFEWERLEPVVVKGKSDPLELWRPLAPRARFGSEVTRGHGAALIGRELEKPLLIGTFERAAQQRSCQLVTIVGEPGVGKSRLCAELFGYLDDRPGLVRWRQGRCLPYGEGIAFWALGEIVKAECGILESDPPEVAAVKLERALPADRDRAWLLARLAPLLGAGGEPAAQEESFAAWRRFCESLASESPAVLVVEDLHWADPALLAFLEHLADWAEGVPLLVLCTARPELYERHPGWGAGLRNATTINLPPLTEEETARLIAVLLERVVLPAETQQLLLERAGGNPLYAEEFVRLLADQGQADQQVEVPESVQALIAARLDTLTPERKSLLQDAAVLGKIFWAGALTEMGRRDPREVDRALHELARKELVRPARSSSMEGEDEYAFWHVLIRDVCYGQIPRAARAARHQAAARWIVEKAGERADDLADVLAHHYQAALELTRAAGRADTGELETQALYYLALAGERALRLDVDRAEQALARALELCPAQASERARLLERWGHAARLQGRLQEARDRLEQALAEYHVRGDRVAAGRTLNELSFVHRRLADPRAEETLAEALALLEGEPPGPELVDAYAMLAGDRFVNSAPTEAIEAAERALRLAARLGLPEPADALSFRGGARVHLGEPEGLGEMQHALELALEQGDTRSAAVIYNNLAEDRLLYEGPRAGLSMLREGVDFCRRRGLGEYAEAMAASSLLAVADLGQTAEALNEARAAADRLQATGNVLFTYPRSLQLRLLAETGDHEQAPDPEPLLTAARDSGEPQMLAGVYPAAAQLLTKQKKPVDARLLLDALDQTPVMRTEPNYASAVPGLVRSALALNDPTLAAGLITGLTTPTLLHQHALASCRAQLAEAAGEHAQAAALYADAAERWQQFGNVPEHAYALLGQGRCLTALDKSGAEQPLREAKELFTALGYKPALAETQALLGESEAAVL